MDINYLYGLLLIVAIVSVLADAWARKEGGDQ